jgi:hypothetical protein
MPSLPGAPSEVRQYAAQPEQDGGGILGHFQQALGNPAVQLFLMSALANVLGDKRGTTPFMLMNQQRRNEALGIARQREGRMAEETRLESERDLFKKQQYMGTLGKQSRDRKGNALEQAWKVATEGIPGQVEQLIESYQADNIPFKQTQIKALGRRQEQKAKEVEARRIWMDPESKEMGEAGPGMVALEPSEYRQFQEQRRPRTDIGQHFEEQDRILAQAEGAEDPALIEQALDRYWAIEDVIEKKRGPATMVERLIAKLPADKQPEARQKLLAKTLSRTGMQIEVDPDGTVRVTQGELTGRQGPTTAMVTKAHEGIKNSELLRGLTKDLRAVLKPENVGVVADLRQAAYGATGQAEAAGSLFSRTWSESLQEPNELTKLLRTEMELAEEDMAKNSDLVSGVSVVNDRVWFDPSLSEAEVLGQIITYKVARIDEPGGRLSVDDAERAEKKIGMNRVFAYVPDVLVRLDVIDKMALGEENKFRAWLEMPTATKFGLYSKEELETYVAHPNQPLQLQKEALAVYEQLYGEDEE